MGSACGGGEGVWLGTRVWPVGMLSKICPPKTPLPHPKGFWNPPGKDFGVETVLGEAQGRTRVGRAGGKRGPQREGSHSHPPSGKAFPLGSAGAEVGRAAGNGASPRWLRLREIPGMWQGKRGGHSQSPFRGASAPV